MILAECFISVLPVFLHQYNIRLLSLDIANISHYCVAAESVRQKKEI
jgi:hypothetical protein